MPRFIVERAFPGGLSLPMTDAGANACARIVGGNADRGVTWIHSYVSADKKRTYCVYEAPSPEAIPPVAARISCIDEWFRSNNWAICWSDSPFCQRSHISAFWLSV